MTIQTPQSKSTTRVTSRMRLDWLVKANRYANQVMARGAYRGDRHRQRATYELRDSLGLLLSLLDNDPEVNGSNDLGRVYVERRSEELRRRLGD